MVFESGYVRDHVSLGYAVTVHSAQGVTAYASIAVLREDTSRSLLYAAMTRGRHANHAYIYGRSTEGSEFGHEEPAGTHVAQRGDSHEAAALIHGILANDEPAITAHTYATLTDEEALSDRIRDLLNMRAAANERRRQGDQAWNRTGQEHDRSRDEGQERHIDGSQRRSSGYGLEL